MLIGITLCGCSRQWYRKAADRDAACLLKSRQFDNRWDIPDRAVEPDPRSRMADLNDPDCGPLPADDPAAHCYMEKQYNSKRRVEYWDRRGTGAMIDAEQWLEYLPYNEEGEVVLTKELAIDLALIHSREFQAQVEQLYLEALSLSQSRFAFNIQWAGGTGATIDLDGAEGVPRTVGNPSRLSASRNFAAGGQLVVDLLNSVTYQIGGGQSNFATGNLLFRLTQPLLRNAFRHVRTEGLTQSERSLLYSVRDFARFRRQFYLQIVQQYLSLLSQSQQIRIEEENIRNLNLNLEFHELKYQQEIISQIQVDQIFQDRQAGRISLIQTRQSLQAALDQFKFQIGLPAKVKIKLDESILEPFKLNSEEVEELQADIDELARSITKYIPPEVPPREYVEASFKKLKELRARASELRPGILAELNRWLKKLEESKAVKNIDANEGDELKFQTKLATRIAIDVDNLASDLEITNKLILENEKKVISPEQDTEVEKPIPDFNPSDPEAPPSPDQAETVELLSRPGSSDESTPATRAFNLLEDAISSLQQDISNLFVTQTKIRLFLIDINPVEIEEDMAIKIALGNRLDLMNDRARVVDSYRRVEVAADQLESDLNLTASADLRTDPNRDNGIRFDGESSRYNVGLQFDGPLNRFSERNSYRAAQIAYQQQRRSYMASEDSIVNEVRADLRGLTQSRFNFQTSRQQLIAAARQVDQTRDRVRTEQGTGDSSVTQDLLRSLANLRNARNGLISSWLNYEVTRIGLFVDLELLLLDEQGRWVNENEKLEYSADSVDALLPDTGEMGSSEGVNEVEFDPQGSDSTESVSPSPTSDDTIRDNNSSEPKGLELDQDVLAPPQTTTDSNPTQAPELFPIQGIRLNGNESPQTYQSNRASGANRTSSRRRSGSVIRR